MRLRLTSSCGLVMLEVETTSLAEEREEDGNEERLHSHLGHT
jgi:hypothetical protein